MTTIGRNDPCPCQSGKKYKMCCLPATEARAAEQRKASQPPSLRDVVQHVASMWTTDDDGLDDLSNSAIDLADQQRFDDALAACDRLLREFPEVVDGLERSGMVHAKMGHYERAADFYRQALAFVSHPDRADDYEDADYYRLKAEEYERLARSA